MKTLFQSAICGCIAITGYINSATAQDLAAAGNRHTIAKSDLLTITSGTAAVGRPTTTVNTNVLRAFIKSHKNAENIRWFNDGNGYLAEFEEDGLKAHASFGKDGYWYYDVCFGSEKDLPAAIRTLIKSNYIDYAIGKATEVNVGNQKAWVVNLEDANNLVLARIMDGRLDELARYDTHAKKKVHRKGRNAISQ